MRGRILLWVGFLLLAQAIGFARPRLDVIRFTNGDKLTCEILKLDRGYLYVSLEQAEGTISLDWSRIDRIESPQDFVVEVSSGRRYTGSLSTADPVEGQWRLRVDAAGLSQLLPGNEVVVLAQTDGTFWRNLHGGINFGANFTKEERRTQFNFSSNARFTRQNWAANADYESSFSGGDNSSNYRNNVRLSGLRQWKAKRQFVSGIAEVLQDSVQGLERRVILGATAGYLVRNDNAGRIALYGGLNWNREIYTAAAPVDRSGHSLEALAGAQLNIFKFKTTNFLLDARVYPSLTNPGRTRVDVNSSARVRLAKNLYWNFGFYLNYDSQPPKGLVGNDYGATGGLGWTF
jgi:Protein of unknown function, DUF481